MQAGLHSTLFIQMEQGFPMFWIAALDGLTIHASTQTPKAFSSHEIMLDYQWAYLSATSVPAIRWHFYLPDW
jgi:hypothetical protein